MPRSEQLLSHLTATAVLLSLGIAQASAPADKCEAAKLQVAGKYELCRLKSEAKALKVGGVPDFAKCDPKFADKWGTAETKAGGLCPTNGDEMALQAFIAAHTDAVRAALDGGPLPTCTTTLAQPLKTGQTTCYDENGTVVACTGSGDDGGLQKGVPPSYVDNGDGTITDLSTGLMWEKLSDDGSTHDQDDTDDWGGNNHHKVANLP